MTDAESGFGVTLSWNTKDITEMTEISGPKPGINTIDVTNHDSSDEYEEFIVGLKNGGEIAVTCNLDLSDEGQAGVITDFEARTTAAWQITYPNTEASTLGGNGIIKDYEVVSPLKGQMQLKFTVKVSGKPTLTV